MIRYHTYRICFYYVGAYRKRHSIPTCTYERYTSVRSCRRGWSPPAFCS